MKNKSNKPLHRKLLSYLYENLAVLRSWWFWLRFVKSNRYIPNLTRPSTFNEKINYRKNHPKHELFAVCADKIRVKEYISSKVSTSIVIPNYYVGDSINLAQVRSLLNTYGDCVLKANHNSGFVYKLAVDSSDAELKQAIAGVLAQLEFDYGKYKNESWYSQINRQVLVEKWIMPANGDDDLKDYKFHVFKQTDGSFKIILGVYFDRNNNTSCSFFDEQLNWLPFHGQYPAIYTKIAKPSNYEHMIQIVKQLAEPFSYVRVDLYNINGLIYFGELTFAHNSGLAPYSSYAYDLWLGNLWQGDPSY